MQWSFPLPLCLCMATKLDKKDQWGAAKNPCQAWNKNNSEAVCLKYACVGHKRPKDRSNRMLPRYFSTLRIPPFQRGSLLVCLMSGLANGWWILDRERMVGVVKYSVLTGWFLLKCEGEALRYSWSDAPQLYSGDLSLLDDLWTFKVRWIST